MRFLMVIMFDKIILWEVVKYKAVVPLHGFILATSSLYMHVKGCFLAIIKILWHTVFK